VRSGHDPRDDTSHAIVLWSAFEGTAGGGGHHDRRMAG